MVALLLVRSITDIPFAVRAVNEFLAYRRSGNGLEQDDEILAVCLKSDLDAGLPIWHLIDHEFGRTPVRVPAASGIVPAGAGLGIRESFSLSGVWTFCWVDGLLLRSARKADARRDAILRMFVEAPSLLGSSPEPVVAFPVFGADEPARSVEAEVRALKVRYPRLIGSSWYRDDKMRGLVTAEPL
jgi:hypothetical protein